MERRAIEIRGTVEGFGFRPFITRLASSLHLGGLLRNQSGRLHIEVEGEAPALDRFLEEVSVHPPALARVEDLSWDSQAPRGERDFRVDESERGGAADPALAADVATCRACRAELFERYNRRYRYPFINCADCGPRLTIVTGAPYDRSRTTMSRFPMCASCRKEHDNPLDRRFGAEPTACAACGPTLSLLDSTGRPFPRREDPVLQFARFLGSGGIGALKGLGGYQLACDARRDEAVGTLRQRKRCGEKPFALMVSTAAEAAIFCKVSDLERSLLESSRAPIVLLEARPEAGPRLSRFVAPGQACLGVMLPSTPVHHLLLAELRDIPLVMTSGNRAEEPIATDEQVVIHLAGIADAFLVHDRSIHVRSEDSVTRVIGNEEATIRRSRGYAPEPLRIPVDSGIPTLAVGAEKKSTFALSRGREAILSHHLGDLGRFSAVEAFGRDVALYEALFDLHPARIVHDLGPGDAGAQYARLRADREGLEAVAVQHHHAHLASCMAENGLTGPVLGVIFDGAGYGTNGALWGGEFLIGDYREFKRAAHLEEVGMPGGEQALREPWRMALSYLMDAGGDTDRLEHRVEKTAIDDARSMLERGVNCPLTSSMERLFEGVASLLGIRDGVTYPGQAAMELEALARRSFTQEPYPVALHRQESAWILRVGPLISALEKDLQRRIPTPIIARRFHATVVEMIRVTLGQLREDSGLEDVVLGGGVFMNELLLRETVRVLLRERFRVHRHRRVPANDGGLCLGQLAVAAAGGGSRPCA